jgi:hypothetical protein
MVETDRMDMNSPSLEIIYESVKDRIAEQSGRIDILDNKAGFTLAAASVLTGGIGTITAGLATFTGKEAKPMKYASWLPGDPSLNEMAAAIIVLILIAYAWLVFSTFQAIRLRVYAVAPKPKVLRAKWAGQEEKSTKAGLIDAMIISFECNITTIEKKTNWTNRAIGAIGIEAGLALVVGALQYWMV